MSGWLVVSYTECAVMFASSFAALAALDYFVASRAKARWFLLHGLWNMVITVVCVPSLLAVIGAPHRALDPELNRNMWPIVMVAALHLWHMIAYSGLTYDDW